MEKFEPVTNSRARTRLREEYDLPTDRRIVLHVGHIKHGRNVHWLTDVQAIEGVQVLVIGSTTTEPESEVHAKLLDAGCDVRIEYFPSIEDLYAISDVYVFPTTSEFDAIRCPASVMEALATGTPAISTRFGALPDLFDSSSGAVTFVDSRAELRERVTDEGAFEGSDPRNAVEPYDWENVITTIVREYGCAVGDSDRCLSGQQGPNRPDIYQSGRDRDRAPREESREDHECERDPPGDVN